MIFKRHITCVFLFFGILVNAQQVLTSEEAIKLALDHNFGIKIANNSVAVADNNKAVLNSGYLPTLTGRAGANIDVQNTEGQLANGEVRIADGAETTRDRKSVV